MLMFWVTLFLSSAEGFQSVPQRECLTRAMELRRTTMVRHAGRVEPKQREWRIGLRDGLENVVDGLENVLERIGEGMERVFDVVDDVATRDTFYVVQLLMASICLLARGLPEWCRWSLVIGVGQSLAGLTGHLSDGRLIYDRCKSFRLLNVQVGMLLAAQLAWRTDLTDVARIGMEAAILFAVAPLARCIAIQTDVQRERLVKKTLNRPYDPPKTDDLLIRNNTRSTAVKRIVEAFVDENKTTTTTTTLLLMDSTNSSHPDLVLDTLFRRRRRVLAVTLGRKHSNRNLKHAIGDTLGFQQYNLGMPPTALGHLIRDVVQRPSWFSRPQQQQKGREPAVFIVTVPGFSSAPYKGGVLPNQLTTLLSQVDDITQAAGSSIFTIVCVHGIPHWDPDDDNLKQFYASVRDDNDVTFEFIP